MPLRAHRPNFWQRLPRRFQAAFGLALVFLSLLIFSVVTSDTRPSVPTVADIKETAQQAATIINHPEIPQLWNPFSHNAHEPLEQANSSRGDSRWYSSLDWLNPFSSSVTLDNERTLLPPPISRTPIYTFYSTADKDNKDVIAIENELILQWRRAWWAQGFKPVVLGPYRFTHAQLEKEGIIVESNVPDNRRPNIYFNITSPTPGTFIIALHYKGREKAILEMDLKIDDLLEKVGFRWTNITLSG